MSPYELLLLILAGGAGTPLTVALVARTAVERHGVQTAAAIQRTTATAERPKELAR